MRAWWGLLLLGCPDDPEPDTDASSSGLVPVFCGDHAPSMELLHHEMPLEEGMIVGTERGFQGGDHADFSVDVQGFAIHDLMKARWSVALGEQAWENTTWHLLECGADDRILLEPLRYFLPSNSLFDQDSVLTLTLTDPTGQKLQHQVGLQFIRE